MQLADPTFKYPFLRRIVSVERGLSVTILAAMVVLPIIGVLARWTMNESFAGLNLYVQSLNLWIAFTGAGLAALAGRHLALSTGVILKLEGRLKTGITVFTNAVAAAVSVMLAYASVQLIRAEMGSDLTLAGGIPIWLLGGLAGLAGLALIVRVVRYSGHLKKLGFVGWGTVVWLASLALGLELIRRAHGIPMWGVQCIMPFGFLVIAFRLAFWGNKTWAGRGVALLAVGLALALALLPVGERGWLVWVGTAVILGAVALGAPIFTAMGGMAMLLFFGQAVPVPISAVPAETYRIVASATLPTIPLFTLSGYILAEGGASRRLVRLFQAWFGWIPGGTAAAAILVCAFFTTFTGASGVTILALGGLLLPTLLKAGYSDRFSIGLLAAAGSIGLLFPPSLPVILYGVVSHDPIDDLYVAGAVPGLVLVLLLVGYGVFRGLRAGIRWERPDFVEIRQAAWNAKWEVALPVLVLVGIFGGFTTIMEAAAFTAAYAFFIEVVVHRDLSLSRDVPRVFVECAVVIGGVLIILGVALGFTSYLVDAEIPMRVAHWVEIHVANKLLFILLLNLFLLVVGCLMDIYSAIMVVVPLIVPIGLAFGIDPLHLGILFLANLELGYLTPPVGMNLFLASYRFERPLTAVYRMALPFLGILALGVLLIAYLPIMTTWPRLLEDEPTLLEQEENPFIGVPDGMDLMQMLDDEPDVQEAPAAAQPAGGSDPDPVLEEPSP